MDLQRAYLLHSRPYRETSLLLDVFSVEQGLVSLVARGARGAKSRQRGCLQLFTPLWLSGLGRGDLLTLTHVETAGLSWFAYGKPALTGFYLNELLVRLLHRHDPHPELFALYEHTLHQLGEDKLQEERALRCFEQTLLAALGYGFALDRDDADELLRPECAYQFVAERGLVRSESADAFKGELLLLAAQQDFSRDDVRQCAKRLMRVVLAHYLGGKPLASRALFYRAPS